MNIVAMTQAIEPDRGDTPARAISDRRHRSSRAAYDRILDRMDAAERRKSTDALVALVRNHPTLAQEQRRIEAHRTRLSHRGEGIAVAGSLAITGLVAALFMTAAPPAAQAAGMLVGALGLAGFRLAMEQGCRFLTLQFLFQIAAGLILIGLGWSGADMAIPCAIALMGWGALGLHLVQLSAARRLDIDEIELMLATQGRQTVQAVHEDMRRRVAAAI